MLGWFCVGLGFCGEGEPVAFWSSGRSPKDENPGKDSSGTWCVLTNPQGLADGKFSPL